MVTSLCLSITGCGKTPEIAPFKLEGKRLTVNNLSKDTWKNVQIQINRQYIVQAAEILPGQRVDVSLDAFLDVYGNHFYYARQQIKDVHLTAKTEAGRYRAKPPASLPKPSKIQATAALRCHPR